MDYFLFQVTGEQYFKVMTETKQETLVTVYRNSFVVLLFGVMCMCLLYMSNEPGTYKRTLTARIEFSSMSTDQAQQAVQLGPKGNKGSTGGSEVPQEPNKDHHYPTEFVRNTQVIVNRTDKTDAENFAVINDQMPPNYELYRMRSAESIRSELKTIRFLQGWQNNPGLINGEQARLYPTNSLHDCGYRCKIEKGLSPVGADIAVFLGVGLNSYTTPPKKSQSDLWVFHTGESQYVSPRGHKKWDGLFNYSTAYIREAGNHGAGWSQPHIRRTQQTYRNFAEERRQLTGKPAVANALWFVSNCQTSGHFKPQSARVPYALELSKYINISAYTHKDACRRPLAAIIKKESKDKQPKFNDFLFYLSFENNACKDYITEKLWKILLLDTFAIPIVLGECENLCDDDISKKNFEVVYSQIDVKCVKSRIY